MSRAGKISNKIHAANNPLWTLCGRSRKGLLATTNEFLKGVSCKTCRKAGERNEKD